MLPCVSRFYRVDPDAHVQLVELDRLADLRDDAQHRDSKLHDIVRFFSRTLPVLLVQETHHYVAVPDRVKLEQVQFVALLVELREQPREHLNYLPRSLASRVRSEPHDVREENSNVGVGLARVVQRGALLDLRQRHLRASAKAG